MNQRQLATVLFAVLGVFIAASRFPEIFFHASLLAQWSPAATDPAGPVSQRSLSIIALSTALLAVLVGFGLVLLRDPLADRLFPAGTQPLTAREAQAVSLSVLGCYLAVQGISRLSWAGRFDWGAAAQLALGVGLFFGARGVSGLWALSRSAGRSRTSSDRAV